MRGRPGSGGPGRNVYTVPLPAPVLPSRAIRSATVCASDSTSRWTPCPPETANGGFRSALAVFSFRLRARLGFSIPSTSPARPPEKITGDGKGSSPETLKRLAILVFQRRSVLLIFHRVSVMATILRPVSGRAIVGFMPLASNAW
jgi:hypothetical protein